MIKTFNISGRSLSLFFAVLFASLFMHLLATPQVKAAAYEHGRLIDDSVFLDARSMSTANIQSFFVGYNAGLANMSFTLDCDLAGSQAKQAYLSLGAPCGQSASASAIIYYASQVYGVSPKVILATMQKEQSVATAVNPASWQINQAMGYACPTSGSCNSASGFFYQIDNGTWALRFHYERARGNNNWWYTSSSWTCGTGKPSYYLPNLYPGQNVTFIDPYSGAQYVTVYIQNAATSAFYCYTPHVYNNHNNSPHPDELKGTSRCYPYSTHPPSGSVGRCYTGSFNFVRAFNQWFGDTQTLEIRSQLVDRYAALGGLSSYLGRPTTLGGCGIPGDGCYQNFLYGHIYWTAATGAWDVSGVVGNKWLQLGAERSYLLYPTAAEVRGLKNGGAYQQFQVGRVYWTAATGAWDVSGGVGAKWIELGAENSVLGYPTGSEVRGLKNGGAYQQFQVGRVYWTAATGSNPVSGGIGEYWITKGAQNSTLGYPTSTEKIDGQGRVYQDFEGGKVYWTAARGAWGVLTSIDARYNSLGGRNSYLGLPYTLGGCGISKNGCYQNFLYGHIYWTAATGAWDVSGGVGAKWIELGAENSVLGYPTGSEVRGLKNGGAYQQFENGKIYWSAISGAREISGSILSEWIELGAENSVLGYPTGSEVRGLKNGGAYQQFQVGRVYWTAATGSNPVSGGIGEYWITKGAQNSTLGYPTSTEKIDGQGRVYQDFEGGKVYWTAARGAWTE